MLRQCIRKTKFGNRSPSIPLCHRTLSGGCRSRQVSVGAIHRFYFSKTDASEVRSVGGNRRRFGHVETTTRASCEGFTSAPRTVTLALAPHLSNSVQTVLTLSYVHQARRVWVRDVRPDRGIVRWEIHTNVNTAFRLSPISVPSTITPSVSCMYVGTVSSKVPRQNPGIRQKMGEGLFFSICKRLDPAGELRPLTHMNAGA